MPDIAPDLYLSAIVTGRCISVAVVSFFVGILAKQILGVDI